MSKAKEKTKEPQLTPEEQELLANARARKEKQAKVEEAIIAILKENNAVLGVDPNSPIGQPMVIVQLL